jgi:hypothetical protein
MCAFIGMNVDREGSIDPSQVRGRGATWNRLVGIPDFDLSDYIRAGQDVGLKTLLTLASESFAGGVDLELYAERYGHLIDAVQIGNEPDLTSDSSWTMDQDTFVQWGRLARSAFPQTPLVAGGLASGQPSWLDGVDLEWADAIACHPYLKDAPNPDDLEDLEDVPILIERYRAFGKPVLVTEWGWWGEDEARGAEEIGEMINWAAHTDLIKGFFYFCWSDAMVPPFGLFGPRGRRKPAVTAFERYAPLAINPTWPPAIHPDPEPEPDPMDDPITDAWRQLWQAINPALPYNDTIAGFGLPTYWREHLRELGSPLGPEKPLGDGATVQTFALGILKWTGTEVERVA